MSRYAFIFRSRQGLCKALNIIDGIFNKLKNCIEDSREFYECFNITTVAYLIIKAALSRPKSLGSHIIIDTSGGNKDAQLDIS